MSSDIGNVECDKLIALCRNKNTTCENSIVMSALSYLVFEKCIINGERINTVDEQVIEMLTMGFHVYISMKRQLSYNQSQRFTSLLIAKCSSTSSEFDQPPVKKTKLSTPAFPHIIQGDPVCVTSSEGSCILEKLEVPGKMHDDVQENATDKSTDGKIKESGMKVDDVGNSSTQHDVSSRKEKINNKVMLGQGSSHHANSSLANRNSQWTLDSNNGMTRKSLSQSKQTSNCEKNINPVGNMKKNNLSKVKRSPTSLSPRRDSKDKKNSHSESMLTENYMQTLFSMVVCSPLSPIPSSGGKDKEMGHSESSSKCSTKHSEKEYSEQVSKANSIDDVRYFRSFHFSSPAKKASEELKRKMDYFFKSIDNVKELEIQHDKVNCLEISSAALDDQLPTERGYTGPKIRNGNIYYCEYCGFQRTLNPVLQTEEKEESAHSFASPNYSLASPAANPNYVPSDNLDIIVPDLQLETFSSYSNHGNNCDSIMTEKAPDCVDEKSRGFDDKPEDTKTPVKRSQVNNYAKNIIYSRDKTPKGEETSQASSPQNNEDAVQNYAYSSSSSSHENDHSNQRKDKTLRV